MNERIKELYEEAKSFYLTDEYILPPSEEDCELIGQKFAELIIKECCVTADGNIDDTKYPSYWIKKKFGVKNG